MANIELEGVTTSRETSENGTTIVHVSFASLMDELTTKDSVTTHTLAPIALNGEERDEFTYLTPTAYSRIVTGDKNAEKNTRSKFKRNKFIPIGLDNRYPNFILELIKRSPTHKSAHKTASNMAYGSGYQVLSEENTEFAQGLAAWLKAIGFDAKFQKASMRSLGHFGGVFVNIVFGERAEKMDAEGNGGDVVETVRISLGNFIERRLGKPDEDIESENFGEVTHHWNNTLMWDTKRKTNPSNWKGIPVYKGPKAIGKERKVINESDTAFYPKNEAANQGFFSHMIGDEADAGTYYPEPPFESSGALNAILLEEAMSYFDLAGIQNGMSAGYIVTASLKDTSKNGAKGKEEYEKQRDAIVNKVMDELSGEERNGNIVIMFQDPRDRAEAIKIAPIPHFNTAEMHKTLEERKRVTIMTAWGIIDERIIGVPNITSKGQSSQSEALKTAEEIFYKLRVLPDFVQPMEDFVRDVLMPLYFEVHNIAPESVPSDLALGFKRNRLFQSSPSDIILLAAYGINEIRAMYGDGPASDDILDELESRAALKKPSTGEPTDPALPDNKEKKKDKEK
jgi:hypothetical protein